MNSIAYGKFSEECVEELKAFQDEFLKDYDLNSYDSWFYNLATGLLTFTTGESQVNFRYIFIGSFSERASTWKWSWDDGDCPDNGRNGVEIMRDFGQKNDFSKLTKGYFESSENEAWEFVAIGAKLFNGIGVYRPVTDNGLKIFLVVTERIDNESAENIKSKYVKCNEHEYRRRAFVCHHLNKVDKLGFEESFETNENMELGEDDDFMAWCNECEVVRQQEDGWNKTSMKYADMRLFCEKCYFEMKEANLGHR